MAALKKKENKKVFVENEAAAIEGEKEALKKKTFHERLLWMKFAPQLNYPFPLFNIYHALNHKRDLCKPQTTYTYQNIVSAKFS